jgi:hypothetical protein
MKPSNNATMLFVVALYHWFTGNEDVAHDAIDVALRWSRQHSDLGDAQ